MKMEKSSVLYSIIPDLVGEEIKENIFESLKNINNIIQDEIFIMFNDFKREYSKDLSIDHMHIYDRNEIRRNMVTSVDMSNTKKFVGEDLKLIRYCTVFNNMIERIENKIKDNKLFSESLNDLFGSIDTDNQIDYTINYNDEHTVSIDIGLRDSILIVLMICAYVFHDTNNFLLEFGDYVCSMDNLNNFRIYIDSVYKLFHSMIHKCNSEYSKVNVFNQFVLMQTYLFIKSLIFINKFNGSNNFIDGELLQNNCERDCIISKDGCSIVFPNVILCSIYLWNQKYAWFNTELFNKFLKKYGNTIKTLGYYTLSREKFNALYGIGILYGLRFTSLSDVNKCQNENVISLFRGTDQRSMKSGDINDNLIMDHNGAISITIKENTKTMKRKNIIIELQTGYPIGNNTISGGISSIHSYIIFDINSRVDFNVYGIYYSENNLINKINEMRAGKDIGYIEYKNDVNGYISGGNLKDNLMIYLMYIIIVLLLIIICSVTLYIKSDDSIVKPDVGLFSKSLL